MHALFSSRHPTAHSLYLRHGAYFPLIAAVLNGTQAGVVYADRQDDPSQVYVEHAFGFAQVFGVSVPDFEQSLRRYWLVDKGFSCAKVRLYTPHCPSFLHSGEYENLRSWRQHFQLDASRVGMIDEAVQPDVKKLKLVHADASNVASIEDAFQVVSRFWLSPDDWANYSNAVLALVDGQPAALCYAAAIADNKAEIDVLTLPAYRHLGLAKSVVHAFIRRCLAQALQPLWDCFTNNAASMALCRTTGFVPLGEPYPFFTINR
ncbi:GNAT family N-acetyltransferase [Variovorax saccharolyticus]|uniref:GNAT family N-acetyltransferase n=1 Tax=Variovorax saccharolyticus TaxID=3053516 RepID=UPI0025780B66|nr:GNAT family N-acetyltransferase [Variovorax sp. J31P216]MDM0028694.1 GNAT family N-acetyltransferase [Variovorax sp. J31P216]